MSSVKSLVVFQEIPTEVQLIIASYSNTKTLLRLSGVNKSASEFLSNEGFFKTHYFKQHPCLEPYNKLFSVLHSTHPSNCWKVMCQVMDVEWAYNSENRSIAKRVSPAFMAEAHPKAIESFKSTIEESEAKNKAICGLYFEDPSSPIDKAWKELEKCNLEGEAAIKEYNNLQEDIELEAKNKQVENDEDQFKSIVVNQFDEDLEAFISSTYEEFMQRAPVENERISRDQFTLYKSLAKKSHSIALFGNRIFLLRTLQKQLTYKYGILESQRKTNEREIEANRQKLNEFLSNPTEMHLEELTTEWSNAWILEQDLKSIQPLNKCRELVKELIDQPEEQTPNAFEEVRSLINACDDDRRIRIWEILYKRCSKGVIEDSWAEKHFKDYLSVLDSVLGSVYGSVKTSIYLIANDPDNSSDPFLST